MGPSVEVREEEDEDGGRVKVITSAVSLVPSEKLDQDTARAIAAVARGGATGGLRIKMHDKIAALVKLGKHLGMFVERAEIDNRHYAISDKPMTKDEWKKRYVTPH